MRFLKSIIGILIVMLFFGNGKAQFYNGAQMSFGKNRVQYNEFFWTYYKFDNYDIYFYLGGKELALYTANYVDENLDNIEDKLDTGLDDKIQFIVYNNLSDLKQSNIGLINDQNYNTGGVTHIIGKKVFLYFDGNHDNFDRQIRSGIAQSIVNQLLYGSSIGSQIKNTSLFPFPDWYLNGLVSYMSEEWSTEIDNRVKDGIISGKYDKFNQLTGIEATYAGHSFWKYIAEKYGESSISNIIYMAKVSRRLESGFLYILGISYKNLQSQALEYYKELYRESDSIREFPQQSLLKKVKPQVVYSRLKISPDGNHVAYTSNWSGQYRVFLQNTNTGKKKRLMKAGFRLEDKVDYSYPLLAWHPSGKILAISIEKKGEVYMYYYMPDEKKFEKIILYQFDKVLDMSYSDDGRSLVLSAVQKGQSDIFVYDIGSNSFDQITNDQYDDLYPRFINNSKEIIFSSNRISDTIRFETKFESQEVQKRYDLFLYKYEDRDNILRRVTKTPLANEIQPMEYEGKYISYLSDENGIFNRYLGRFDSTISYIDTTTHYRYFTNSFPITNYSRNILEHDVAPEANKYAQILFKDRKYFMQIYDQLPPESLSPVQLEPTAYMDQLETLYGVKPAPSVSDKNVIISEAPQVKSKGFSTVKQSDAIREIQRKIVTDSVGSDNIIDTQNYQLGTNEFSKEDLKNWDFTILDVPLPDQKAKDTPPKRLNYNVEYSISEIVTQVDFSYLYQTYQPYAGGTSPIFLNPGFNALFKIGVMDLLEDYRIIGGVRLSLNLVNNEYLLSYANLKRRLDKEIIFHRNSIESYDDYFSILRVYSHELFYVLKYPLNQIMAIKGTASFRNDLAVTLSTDAVNLARPNRYRNLVGVKGEFIYDNTKSLGVNLFYGTRFKIFGEFYQWADKEGQNLAVIGFDIRNYQRIHRTLIWANRFATSTSFGSNKLIYYMGGVDNWLFPKFNITTPVDQEQNYAYQTLANNLRGFDQNIRNGNSFFVINSELRFPIFRYLANKPIKSDFLNNFQIVGFGDVGTAWTGLHPFSDDNYLFTNTIERPPLNITVKLQKDPIVGGFGFGARTRILGYFIRADVAWGVEDMVINPAIFYLSLSLDF